MPPHPAQHFAPGIQQPPGYVQPAWQPQPQVPESTGRSIGCFGLFMILAVLAIIIVFVVQLLGRFVGSPDEDPSEATTGGIDAALAMTACDFYAAELYPYGFDTHAIVGQRANDLLDADSWIYSVDVTITNAFGAEYDATMDCVVGGSATAPIVEQFNVY